MVQSESFFLKLHYETTNTSKSMKKLAISVLAIIPFVFLFNSCKQKSIDFDKVDYKKVVRSPLAKDTAMGHCSVDIQLLYPSKFSDKEVLAKVQQQIITYCFDSTYAKYNGKQAVDVFAKSTFDNYTDFINTAIKANKDNINNRLVFHNETWRMNTVILYNDKDILSYELDRYSETGGAHGSESTQYLVFDLNTGKKLTQHDIFEEGFEPKVADLLKKQIMADKGFESEEQMLNNGYFFAENITPNGNFSVSEQGITFVFNPYEIAAYSLGQTEVTIPFQKLKSCLKKNSPIESLLQK
jgi:hypothetical protein